MNVNFKRILYTVLALVIVFIIAYPKLDFSGEKPGQSQASAPVQTLLSVQGMTVIYEPLDYVVRVTGTIIADESVNLNAEVSGKVEQIFYKEGQDVKRGQLLLTLNDDELVAELEKLKFNKKLYEDNEFRQRSLLESEAISREEYEIALTTLNISLAEISLLETRQAKHRIRAPFDGKIGLRQVSVGSYIQTGSAISSIYRINPVKIDFSIPGRYLKEINVGDKLRFTVDAYEEEFEGQIYALEPQIDPQSRSIKLRATSPNPDYKLLPGQFAKINLILDRVENAIMVPSLAVIPELNATKVFVYKDGKVDTRRVETGIRMEDKVQVVSGLEPGEVVITSGLMQIRQGMEVTIED